MTLDNALIGGAACDLIFTDVGLPFRATRDLDIVLCVDVVDKNFAYTFQGFLEAGGYKAGQKGDGQKEYYRFHQPTNNAYPYMIEVFSRQSGGFEFIADDLRKFLSNVRNDETFGPRTFKVLLSRDEGIALLENTPIIKLDAGFSACPRGNGGRNDKPGDTQSG